MSLLSSHGKNKMREIQERVGRNHELKLRLGKEEKEKLQKKANELGIKLSQYIRMVSLNATIEVKK